MEAGSAVSNAPPVNFSYLAPPLELRDVPSLPPRTPNSVGWLTISLFAQHADTPAKLQNALAQAR